MAYWLLKTEPHEFSYDDLVRLGRDAWDGVHNYTALRHLGEMRPGDAAFVYHTGNERRIVGVCRVVSAPYPDPKESNPRFVVADVAPAYRFARPVGLAAIKADPDFAGWELVRISRLSVMPVPEPFWLKLHAMGDTPLPAGAPGGGPTAAQGEATPLTAPAATSGLAVQTCEACRIGAPPVSEAEWARLGPEIPDWNLIREDGGRRLEREFSFGSYKEALAFTQAVGELAEAEGHHPRLTTEYKRVAVTWWTHKIQDLHRNDLIMAAKTDRIYAGKA